MCHLIYFFLFFVYILHFVSLFNRICAYYNKKHCCSKRTYFDRQCLFVHIDWHTALKFITDINDLCSIRSWIDAIATEYHHVDRFLVFSWKCSIRMQIRIKCWNYCFFETGKACWFEQPCIHPKVGSFDVHLGWLFLNTIISFINNTVRVKQQKQSEDLYLVLYIAATWQNTFMTLYYTDNKT